MLYFYLLWGEMDFQKFEKKGGLIHDIISLLNVSDCDGKKTIIYIPKRVREGYGAEFIPTNINTLPERLMRCANELGYAPQNFLVVDNRDSLTQLLTALHKRNKICGVVGILETLMKYVYSSKERTALNNSNKGGVKEKRGRANKKLQTLQFEIIKEMSLTMFSEDFPVFLLWLGYSYKYREIGKKKKSKKIFMYSLIKKMGKIQYNNKRH